MFRSFGVENLCECVSKLIHIHIDVGSIWLLTVICTRIPLPWIKHNRYTLPFNLYIHFVACKYLKFRLNWYSFESFSSFFLCLSLTLLTRICPSEYWLICSVNFCSSIVYTLFFVYFLLSFILVWRVRAYRNSFIENQLYSSLLPLECWPLNFVPWHLFSFEHTFWTAKHRRQCKQRSAEQSASRGAYLYQSNWKVVTQCFQNQIDQIKWFWTYPMEN